MRVLSFTLLDTYRRCPFRCKLRYFDQVAEEGPSSTDLVLGILAHEGQRAVLERRDPEAAIAEAAQGLRFEDEAQRDQAVRQAARLVAAWRTDVPGWAPDQVVPVEFPAGRPLIERSVRIPLDPPLGIFTHVVVRPDLVAYGAHGEVRVVDWKWRRTLKAQHEPYEYDLQAVFYQYVLACAGVPALYCEVVEGSTSLGSFRMNRDGRVSRRAVRGSWEEYTRACAEAGHPPDEGMRDRLKPRFVRHVNYRSLREVEALWHHAVVPVAEAISRDYDAARWARAWQTNCLFCPYRVGCRLGLTGEADDPAYNR